MDYEVMKLECLKLAVAAGHRGDDAIKMAERYYNHCRDRSPSQDGAKARVVGMDSDFEKPFKDYLAKDQ